MWLHGYTENLLLNFEAIIRPLFYIVDCLDHLLHCLKFYSGVECGTYFYESKWEMEIAVKNSRACAVKIVMGLNIVCYLMYIWCTHAQHFGSCLQFYVQFIGCQSIDIF